MELPEETHLDIAKLSSVFRDTTNSYKFYWFLSILDSLSDNGNALITQKEIALRMLSNVWYPLDYFKLSFGSQDGFKKVAQYVSSQIKVDNRPASPSLFEQIKKRFSEKDIIGLSQEIKQLYRWVPFRFIRPFFEVETRGLLDQNVNHTIANLCNDLFDKQHHRVIYRFVEDAIELNPIWVEYFQKHQTILRGFIQWHLIRFVQKNNPTVIGLSEKLQKPTQRSLNLAHKFWRGYLAQNPNSICIYSGQTISIENLSLDHFLPWSYVAHDQLWNIIPTSKTVNSAKNDCLPSFDLYFQSFASLQFDVFCFYRDGQDKANRKFMEDYRLLFREDLTNISGTNFVDLLHKVMLPQFQTAENMGFRSQFKYQNE